jgi:hypothetical protein
MSDSIPSPWQEFLRELDALLPEQVTFECVGGFAVIVAYGLPRSTNDLDYFTLEPSNLTAVIHNLAGEGLHSLENTESVSSVQPSQLFP